MLEWVATPFSRASSLPRDWTQASCIAGRFLTNWATSKALRDAGELPKKGRKFYLCSPESMITDMCSLPGKWPKAEFLVMGLKLTSISELRTEGREVTMKRRKWAPEIGSVIIATFSQLRSPQGRSWDPVLQTSQLSSRRLNNIPRVAGGERSLNMNPAVLYFESAPFISLLVRVWNFSVQFSRSVMSNSLRPHESQHARPPCPSPTPGVYIIESVMPSNHLILCHPLLLPPTPPSIRVFSNESVLCIRWPKYCSFSFSISPSNEHPGPISFRMDWLDLLAVQGTLKSLLQHHSSKVSILLCSAFFTVQLSHPYMTTGKTIALTRWTFVGKVMSLLFNMLSRLVITFLP